jgi:hypothetical protein
MSDAANGDLERLADRLDEIGEELADLAMAALRRALDEGEDARPATERRITRARRSVEKAASLLRGAEARSPYPD